MRSKFYFAILLLQIKLIFIILNLGTIIVIYFVANLEINWVIIKIEREIKDIHLNFLQYSNSAIKKLVFYFNIIFLNLIIKIVIIKYSIKYYIS